MKIFMNTFMNKLDEYDRPKCVSLMEDEENSENVLGMIMLPEFQYINAYRVTLWYGPSIKNKTMGMPLNIFSH